MADTFEPITREAAFSSARLDTHGRLKAFEHAQRNSRRVRWLRRLIPLATLGIAVIVGVYMRQTSLMNLSTSGAGSPIAEGKLVMADPKLEGFAKNGRPYLITAIRAVQNFDQQNIVVLEGINAKMPVGGENWGMVRAQDGILDRTTNTLTLSPEVYVTTTNGMNAKLKSAFIEISTGNLKTIDPVDIQFQTYRIVADAMTITDGGKLLVFENHVRMNINSQ